MSPERFAVIGDPVAHSLSPAMHNAALRAAGIDASYGALRIDQGDLSKGVELLWERGYWGFNVTVPHKVAIRAFVDRLARSAAEVTAVNTVVRRQASLEGHNTDVHGFMAALHLAGVDVSRQRAVVFGTGGAGLGVVCALHRLGAHVVLVSRTPEKARSMAGSIEGAGELTALAADDPEVPTAIGGAALVVNATPLGMDHLPAASPLPPGVQLWPPIVAFDLIYGRETPFLREAASRGCRTLDGLEMLVQQGAESFRLWTGVEPEVGVMREACLNELKEREPCSDS
jgi:shikimate dehydrogenase